MLGYHKGKVLLEPNLSFMLAQHFSNLVHSTHIYLPMKMEQTECSETSAYKLQTPGNYPEESIKNNIYFFFYVFLITKFVLMCCHVVLVVGIRL